MVVLRLLLAAAVLPQPVSLLLWHRAFLMCVPGLLCVPQHWVQRGGCSWVISLFTVASMPGKLPAAPARVLFRLRKWLARHS